MQYNYNPSTQKEIEGEAIVMSLLKDKADGASQNIVIILKHGEFKAPWGYYYFIDMELGTFDLETYIRANFGGEVTGIDWASLRACIPVVVQRDCSPTERLRNWCTIGAQIASGLKYVHSCGVVHRDLKPANGTHDHVNLSLNLVLYFPHGNKWKLSDFGISGRALTQGVTTEQSRGTPSYRAPELLKKTSKFTTKVDLWALGCILHEYMTGEKTFPSDYAVTIYTDDDPLRHLVWSPQIWHDFVCNTVKHLLRCEPAHRPTAADMVDLFAYYKSILVDPVSPLVFNCPAGLSYKEWDSLRLRCSNEVEWLCEFAECYKLKGEKSVAGALFDEMTQVYLERIQRLRSSNRPTNQSSSTDVGFWHNQDVASTVSLFEKMLCYLPRWLLAWVCHELALFLSSTNDGNWEEAISICKHGLEKDQDNLILPMLLSNLYAERGRYNDAVRTENHFVYKACPDVNLATVESSLLGFYARVLPTKPGYLNSIVTFLQS
jgi:serine/threonine protein kinase